MEMPVKIIEGGFRRVIYAHCLDENCKLTGETWSYELDPWLAEHLGVITDGYISFTPGKVPYDSQGRLVHD